MATAIIVLASLAGCAGRDPESIKLPPTPVVNLRPTWAVVVEPYVRLLEGPDDKATISGHLRYGDVARIDAIGTVVVLVDGARHYWYQLSVDGVTGWVLDSVLESYNSEQRARNAAARLER